MSELIMGVRPRYVVETGEVEQDQFPEVVEPVVHWSFHRAFRDLSNAKAWAWEVALVNEWVRIVDRGD